MVLTAWVLVLAGMTTLLVAANQKRQEQVCSKVMVTIKGTGEKFYIDETDILRQLQSVHGKLVGKPLPDIRLSVLEQSLEHNQWIRNAELYFDRENVLHVFAEEREPIARVFTTTGNTFYMDSSGHRMPLMDKMSIRVPVITGFMNLQKTAKDSAFMAEIKHIAWTVYNDPFWSAQTGQIDITPNRKFEIVPVVGNHIIRIGDAADLEDKFKRLLLFYKQVMSKAGFHKYAVVDAQFAGQIVGVHKGTVSAVDSIQLNKNIAELLLRSSIRHLHEDMLPFGNNKDSVSYIPTPSVVNKVPSNPNPSKDSTLAQKPAVTSKTNVPVQAKPFTSHSKKTVQPSKAGKKEQKPKATMKGPAINNEY
jgi:cell division protein FtsQ